MKKSMIPMNECGIMADSKCVVRVDSRYVAEKFGRNHKDVLRCIKRIIGEDSGYSLEFTERNFTPSHYKDSTGRILPCYLLTRDGFVALTMGFTGKKADQFKEWYINRFNEMESQIRMVQSLRDQNPMLTHAIHDTRENPKPYDYSNESDMINRIVLGMSARKYREKYGIPKNEAIRPHLSTDEAELMNLLMTIDIGLQYSTPDFQERKRTLEWKTYQWWKAKGLIVIDKKIEALPADNESEEKVS